MTLRLLRRCQTHMVKAVPEAKAEAQAEAKAEAKVEAETEAADTLGPSSSLPSPPQGSPSISLAAEKGLESARNESKGSAVPSPARDSSDAAGAVLGSRAEEKEAKAAKASGDSGAENDGDEDNES